MQKRKKMYKHTCKWCFREFFTENNYNYEYCIGSDCAQKAKANRIRSAEQRRRERKRIKEEAAWNAFSLMYPDVVNLTKRIYDDLKLVIGERHIYIDYIRGTLKQFHEIHTANINYTKITNEIRKDPRYRWAFK